MPYQVMMRDGQHCVVKQADGSTVACHATKAEADAHMKALYANVKERDFSADERKMMAKKGHAMADGSFPIATMADLMNAIHAIGRASDPAAAKAHIIKRARALGLTDKLPKDWQGSTQESTERGQISEAVSAQLLEMVEGSNGSEWDILIIEPGLSLNGNNYSPAVLKAAASLYEGVWSYTDHEGTHRTRNVADKVGRIRGVRYDTREVGGQQREGLYGRFRVIDPVWRDRFREAVAAGEPDAYGFSHDVAAEWRTRREGMRQIKDVSRINVVRSVDVVNTPAAGGRLVAGMEDDDDMSVTLEEIQTLLEAKLSGFKEEIKAELGAPPPPGEPTDPEPTPAEVKAATDAAKQALRESTKERQRNAFTRQVEATKLSTPGKALLTARFEETLARREVEDSEIATIIKEAVEYEALFTENQEQRQGIGIQFEAGATGRDRFIADLKAMFATPQDKQEPGVRPFTSFKEAYVKFTGKWDADLYQMMEDYTVRGGYVSSRDHTRLQESLTTASWGQIFADVMYQMLMNAYVNAPWYDRWRDFCSAIENVPDFRTRHWMRIGGYGDLPAVSEGATYQTTTSPTDEEATYAVTKRGFLDDITMESILDDRVNAVTRLVREMGRAAARTLYKFVLNMITTDNSNTTYDSTAFYVAGHGNTGTTALTVSGLYTTQQAMMDQTAYNQTSEILGDRNRIKFIIVPNELTARAERITNPSEGYLYGLNSNPDTDTSLDPWYWKGRGIVAHTYNQLTDATDWWAVADPNSVDTLVMGFLGGRQEPEFFTQDQPQNGSVFTADKVSYKTRFIFSGAILEHRSFYRQVVAG